MHVHCCEVGLSSQPDHFYIISSKQEYIGGKRTDQMKE